MTVSLAASCKHSMWRVGQHSDATCRTVEGTAPWDSGFLWLQQHAGPQTHPKQR